MKVYLNGALVEAVEALVSVFDRGFVFGDGVYEVVRSTRVPGGGRSIIGLDRHVRRLRRSLREVRIEWDVSAFGGIVRSLLDEAGLVEGLVYLQVTRGTPDLQTQPARSHMPPVGMRPTVFAYARPFPGVDFGVSEPPAKRCVVCRDERWGRCDIKSIALLGHLLGSMAAQEAGADEAFFVKEIDGRRIVTEGAHTNIALVTRDGEIVTPSLDSAPMLSGVTRDILLEAEPTIVQRVVFEAELRAAREVMALGTTALVGSVTHLDGVPVGDGGIGPVARRLYKAVVDAIMRGA